MDEERETKTCKCGCGQTPGKSWEYVRGHKPKGPKAPPEPELVEEDADGPTVTLEMQAHTLDAVWKLLSLWQKAVAIQAGIAAEDE